MNRLEKVLKEALVQAFKNSFNLVVEDIMLEIPKNSLLGDYSSNVALRYAKTLKTKPQIVANKLKEELLAFSLPVHKIEVAGPGFINFYLKESALASCINVVIEKADRYGENKTGAGQKVLVEYVSVNPTGDVHVGHSKAAAWGDSTTRLMKASSYEVLREFYINDGGNQIDNLGESLLSRYLELFDLDYPMPTDGYYGPDIIEIAQDIKDCDGDKWLTVDQKERLEYFKTEGTKRELEKIQEVLSRFGVTFDSWISEKKIREDGRIEEVIERLHKAGFLYEEDGALWFASTRYGDDKDRVLRKQDGSYTYLAPDIAYHAYKIERGYSKLVDLFGADHHGYVARIKAALQALGNDSDCLEVDLVQMVRLLKDGTEVKMSKRTGNVITLSELIEDIGVDPLRYFFCSRDVSSHLDFDLDLAVKQSADNPVYYAQYAHARICSILKMAPSFKKQEVYSLLTHEKEVELLKLNTDLPNEVASAAKTRGPKTISNYIQLLAQAFHAFYGLCKVIDSKNPKLSNERCGLLLACKITMKNALNLIGVSAPEKM
ncbi:arginine--tRNA ligase [bacterium]|nr:arginine--tRNA ligase [bacterium]